VNPPFSDDLIEASITHIEDLLSELNTSNLLFRIHLYDEKDDEYDPQHGFSVYELC
jgi:hypothetical protein